MRLLIFTQKVDKNDSVLGFFHTWIEEFAKKTDEVTVICLEKGEFSLPSNVVVYSLGKEEGGNKIKYLIKLFKYLFLIRGSYDKVFVHMNQEYILLCGWYWKFFGIPIYFWRNHPLGNIFTRMSVVLSSKVFYTSKKSFVAKYKKSVCMPVGNNTKLFSPVASVIRKKYSICMLGRISPIKHIELGLMAVKEVLSQGKQISLHIFGSSNQKDKKYYSSLKKYVTDNELSSYVFFNEEVPFDRHPEVFSSYEINLNLTPSGSFDKTIVGGVSCGAIPLVSNDSLVGILPEVCITKSDSKSIASSIIHLLDPQVRVKIQDKLDQFTKNQSLDSLIDKLFKEIND